MVNKEDYRDFDSLINWGKYAEALEKENKHLRVALKCYEALFVKAANEIQELNNELVDTTELSKNTKSRRAKRIEELEKAQYKLIELVQENVPCPNDYPCAECKHDESLECHFTVEDWKKWSEGVLND